MIRIDLVAKDWQEIDGWKIAPAGVPWIAEGSRIKIGASARSAVDIGFADGYRKCIAEVNGIAYIGAGCRWFTLAEALKHWGNHAENRRLTMCLLESAKAIATLNGWKF